MYNDSAYKHIGSHAIRLGVCLRKACNSLSIIRRAEQIESLIELVDIRFRAACRLRVGAQNCWALDICTELLSESGFSRRANRLGETSTGQCWDPGFVPGLIAPVQLVELVNSSSANLCLYELLKRGFRAKPRHGAHTVHDCVRRGEVEKLKLLIEFGADVNARDSEGSTALHLATEGSFGYLSDSLYIFQFADFPNYRGLIESNMEIDLCRGTTSCNETTLVIYQWKLIVAASDHSRVDHYYDFAPVHS